MKWLSILGTLIAIGILPGTGPQSAFALNRTLSNTNSDSSEKFGEQQSGLSNDESKNVKTSILDKVKDTASKWTNLSKVNSHKTATKVAVGFLAALGIYRTLDFLNDFRVNIGNKTKRAWKYIMGKQPPDPPPVSKQLKELDVQPIEVSTAPTGNIASLFALVVVVLLFVIIVAGSTFLYWQYRAIKKAAKKKHRKRGRKHRDKSPTQTAISPDATMRITEEESKSTSKSKSTNTKSSLKTPQVNPETENNNNNKSTTELNAQGSQDPGLISNQPKGPI